MHRLNNLSLTIASISLYFSATAFAQIPNPEQMRSISNVLEQAQKNTMGQAESLQNIIQGIDSEQIQEQERAFKKMTQDALNDDSLNKNTALPDLKFNSKEQVKKEALEKRDRQLSATDLDGRLSDLLDKYNKEHDKVWKKAQNDVPDINENAVYVFVSFSMPDHVLKNLSKQASEFGATLVLRGMVDGSLESTKVAAADINTHGSAWEINPELFKVFKVKNVPTFVVTGNQSVLDGGCAVDNDACSLEGAYASISGDLSVELALQTIYQRSNVPYIQDLTKNKLIDYKGRLP